MSINTVGNIVLMFAQWLISVLLVRMGGFADAGVFSLAMSISNVFSAMANCGTRTYQVSDISGQFTQNQYLLNRSFTIIASFLLCGIYLLFDSSYSKCEAISIMAYLLYSNSILLSDIICGTLQVRGRLELNGYSYIIKGIACLCSFLLAYAYFHNLPLSIAIMGAITLLLTLVYDLKYYRETEKIKWPSRADLKAAFYICKVCLPLLVLTILPITVIAYPRRLINLYLGNKMLGYYSSLFTPTVVISTMMPAMFLGLMPKIAEMWENGDRRSLETLTSKCYLAIVAITFFVAILALIGGKIAIKIIFGEEILPYFNLLYLAVLASGLNSMTICGRLILTSFRKSGWATCTAGIELLLTVVLSGYLVSEMGIYGGAVVLIISYGIHAALQAVMIRYFMVRQAREKGNGK